MDDVTVENKVREINNMASIVEDLKRKLEKLDNAITSADASVSINNAGEVIFYGYNVPSLTFPAQKQSGVKYNPEVGLSEQEYDVLLTMIKSRLTKRLEQVEKELQSKLK